MFNKRFLKIIAKTRSNFFNLLTLYDDRKILKKIKQIIIHDIFEGEYSSVTWSDDSIEGLYVQAHKRYFTRRGFNVALGDGYVTINWL